MTLIGAANPAGISTSLNTIGNHAYATNFNAAQAAGTFNALDFTTGNYYIIASVNVGIDNKPGSEHEFRLTTNGEITYESKSDNGKDTALVAPFGSLIKVLLPPQSRIQMAVEVNATTPISISLVGRIYA
tara:strand:+ start:552 stop:941 length:390 start_codon:yes stop_codon:yes gene_type:complete